MLTYDWINLSHEDGCWVFFDDACKSLADNDVTVEFTP